MHVPAEGVPQDHQTPEAGNGCGKGQIDPDPLLQRGHPVDEPDHGEAGQMQDPVNDLSGSIGAAGQQLRDTGIAQAPQTEQDRGESQRPQGAHHRVFAGKSEVEHDDDFAEDQHQEGQHDRGEIVAHGIVTVQLFGAVLHFVDPASVSVGKDRFRLDPQRFALILGTESDHMIGYAVSGTRQILSCIKGIDLRIVHIDRKPQIAGGEIDNIRLLHNSRQGLAQAQVSAALAGADIVQIGGTHALHGPVGHIIPLR